MGTAGPGKAPAETTAEIPKLGQRRKPVAPRSRSNAVQSRPGESLGLPSSDAEAPARPLGGRPRGAGQQWDEPPRRRGHGAPQPPSLPGARGHMSGQRSGRTPASGQRETDVCRVRREPEQDARSRLKTKNKEQPERSHAPLWRNASGRSQLLAGPPEGGASTHAQAPGGRHPPQKGALRTKRGDPRMGKPREPAARSR